MSKEKVSCLFCQTINDQGHDNCSHCGMSLAKDHPHGKARQTFFLKAFVLIVIFCAVMVYYLPR